MCRQILVNKKAEQLHAFTTAADKLLVSRVAMQAIDGTISLRSNAAKQ